MSHILVTGGTGYIGSHICVELLKAGHEVSILDNLYNSEEEVINSIESISGRKIKNFYTSDITIDFFEMYEMFENNKFDGVIHLAGYKAVGESCEKPGLYFENNVSGSINLFNSMLGKAKNIIFSSTAVVYDTTKTGYLSELTELGPVNPYGMSKLCVDQILSQMCKFGGLKGMSLRYFNPIGNHESGLIGDNPNGVPNNLFPFVMQVVSGKREKVGIFGNDYETPDGSGVRDYIDVNELAKVHVLAIEKLIEKPDNYYEVFNIGSGKGTSVIELVEAVNKVTGGKAPYEFKDRRAGDAPVVVAIPDKFEKEFGVKIKLDLEQCIRNGIKFQENHK